MITQFKSLNKFLIPVNVCFSNLDDCEKERIDKILLFLSDFAHLTGSALVPDVIPKDYDFFAKLDESTNDISREMLGELNKFGFVCIDNASLSKEWGPQRQFELKISQYRIELFFVASKYFGILKLITKVMRYLCNDRLHAMVLRDKDARIHLYNSIRNSILGK